MLKFETVLVTPFMQNCRVIWATEGGPALVVDPGGDVEKIFRFLETNRLNCTQIWLTHSHLDHCGGVADLIEQCGTKPQLIGHPIEKAMRQTVGQISEFYGLPSGYLKECPEPSQYVEGGEYLDFNGFRFEVRYTPGHSPGHVVFYCKQLNTLLAGDTLFSGSIGRTDLPGGNHEELILSIESQIFSLPKETKVLCGHGEDTLVGDEIRGNPFFSG